ncbi:alpha-hydroxy acid oxidase [Streptosporangium carneum]|uniref:Alpha-hydroxy-acid oxidizing enzyme n=1 Tax=Streptosporangium carneum TaxID=47481 RepID=A0A9W6MBZ0_9ACTN|nr:alpha-hydroxy acid oxidase [Streptosporangium carneum]GLK08621.1 alpha-hydroxy-acid oxidizing enzyme [Streptosporangium carneum]
MYEPPVCLAEFEEMAAKVLPGDIRDFIDGGSGREQTLHANRAAFDRVFLVPRVLRDVSACSTRATLLGRPAAMPVAVAPVAYHRLAHHDGELATARAARDAGVPFTVSTLSSVPVEDVTALGGHVWFQLYCLRDHAATLGLIRRAEDAGCRALMLTLDVPWMARRLRDMRNQFRLPPHVRPVHLTAGSETEAHRGASGGSALAAHTAMELSAAVDWSYLETLRAASGLPLMVKGILDPEDARRAADIGVDGIVVSNHGGRQLDGAIASLDALPGVAESVGDRCEIMLDGGVRSGADVLKALALGASGVLVGRPVIWGLAADGERGVRTVLDLLGAEIKDGLGLTGCGDVAAARALKTTWPGTSGSALSPISDKGCGATAGSPPTWSGSRPDG